MHIVSKSVPVKLDIIGQIFDKCFEFERTYGEKPIAVALGPNEYMSAVAVLSNELKYSEYQNMFYPECIMGLKILLKTDNGISLIIDSYKFAAILSKGSIV